MSKANGSRGKIFSGKLHPGFWVLGISLLTAGVHNALELTGDHSLLIPLVVGAALGIGLFAYTKKNRKQVRGLHKTGAAIRKSEVKYRTFFENSTDAMLIIEEGEFIDCNEAAVAMLGYDRKEEVIHTHPSKLSPEFQPDDRPSAEKADEMMRRAKEQGSHRFEWDHLRRDGTVFPVEVSLTAIQGDGKTQLHTVWRDLSDRKLAGEALRKSELLLRSLIEAIPDLIWLKDPEGVYLFCNSKFGRFFGAKASEIVGKTDYDFVDRELADFFREKDRIVMASGGPNINEEDIVYADDGHEEKLETLKTPVCASDGTLLGVLGVGHDITERKRAEEAREQAHAFLQEVIDGFPEELLVINRDYTIALANRTARKAAGDDPVSACLKCYQVSHHRETPCADAEHPCPFSVVFETRKPVTLEHIHTDAEGRKSVVEVVAAPIFDQAGEVIQIVESCRDITERTRAEESLRASEEKFRGLVESSGDWIWEVNDSYVYTYCSPQVEKILGYKPEEIVGKTPSDLATPEEDARLQKIFFEKAKKGLPIVAIENVNLHKDGREVVLETSGVPFFDEAGKVAGYRGVDRDVTESRRTERMLQAIFDAAGDGFLMVDAQTRRLVAANAAMAQLLGYSAEELKTMAVEDIHTPEDLDYVQSQIEKQLRGEISLAKDIRLKRKDGTLFFTEVRSTSMELYGRKHLLGIFRDTTEQKKSEESLLASMQKLALHVEQTPLGVVEWDLDFKVTEWNPAAERIFGYTQEEALGQHATFIVPKEVHEYVNDVMKKLLTEAGGTRSNNENITKDGRTILCEWYNTPLIDVQNQVVGAASLVLDITDRIQAEEAREELEVQLRQAQKMEAVGQMAGGIAHDFNNLLQIIGGYAELSQVGMDPENPAADPLKEIDKAANRGKRLISQLLAFSRRQVLRPVDLNLNEVIAPSLKMIRGLIGEHIKLDFIPGHGLGVVHADRGLMEQVLMNLCVNARDAMPSGGTLTIETENVLIDSEYAQAHSWAVEGRCILLNVCDTGVGMDQKTLERVFEPFFTTKEVGKGTGLGLSMAYGIITQHKGHIAAYSEPGQGTIFKIYLPVVEHLATEISSVVPGPVSGGSETLLVAEDDEAVLNLLERMLHEAGYTVLTAKDGQEAIRKFKEHAGEIDMLLFDVVMPRMGGKEAMEKILKMHPDLPHLFASGYSENAVHTNFIQNRGLHLLSKPYQTNTLLRKIREVLEESGEPGGKGQESGVGREKREDG